MPKNEAIIEAGHKRAQPIVMTTVAMVAGMVPIAISLVGRRQLARADGRHRDRRPDLLDHADPAARPGLLQPSPIDIEQWIGAQVPPGWSTMASARAERTAERRYRRSDIADAEPL